MYVGSYAARSQIHRSCPPRKGIHFGTSPETDERRVLHLHRHRQRDVQRVENGDLHHHRQAAAEGVHLVGPVQLHRLPLQALRVALVLRPQRIDLRLQRLHRLHRPHALEREREEQHLRDDRQQDDRHTVVRDESVEPAHHPEDRHGDPLHGQGRHLTGPRLGEREAAEVNRLLEAHIQSLQLVVLHRTEKALDPSFPCLAWREPGNGPSDTYLEDADGLCAVALGFLALALGHLEAAALGYECDQVHSALTRAPHGALEPDPSAVAAVGAPARQVLPAGPGRTLLQSHRVDGPRPGKCILILRPFHGCRPRHGELDALRNVVGVRYSYLAVHDIAVDRKTHHLGHLKPEPVIAGEAQLSLAIARGELQRLAVQGEGDRHRALTWPQHHEPLRSEHSRENHGLVPAVVQLPPLDRAPETADYRAVQGRFHDRFPLLLDAALPQREAGGPARSRPQPGARSARVGPVPVFSVRPAAAAAGAPG